MSSDKKNNAKKVGGNVDFGLPPPRQTARKTNRPRVSFNANTANTTNWNDKWSTERQTGQKRMEEKIAAIRKIQNRHARIAEATGFRDTTFGVADPYVNSQSNYKPNPKPQQPYSLRKVNETPGAYINEYVRKYGYKLEGNTEAQKRASARNIFYAYGKPGEKVFGAPPRVPGYNYGITRPSAKTSVWNNVQYITEQRGEQTKFRDWADKPASPKFSMYSSRKTSRKTTKPTTLNKTCRNSSECHGFGMRCNLATKKCEYTGAYGR